jgi:hypothetical protein
MSCCGQKREALATARPPSLPTSPTLAPTPARFTSFAKPPAPAPTPVSAPAILGSLVLRYLARSAVQVRGPSTGRMYPFSAAQPVQRVARADGEALLRSGHFRLEA